MPPSQLFAGDILEGTDALKKSMQGADAMIIATSAIPEIKPSSLIRVRSAVQADFCYGTPLHAPCLLSYAHQIDVAIAVASMLQVFWKKLLRQQGARPDFKFKKYQYPEQVGHTPDFMCVSSRIIMRFSAFDLPPIQQSRHKT